MDVETEETCSSTVVNNGTTWAENTHVENGDLRKPQWSNTFQSIIAVLGFSVGLGNLLRFPYVCQKNGGGAFLIPYAICATVIALPLFILEVALGQFSAKGPVNVWTICPLMKGIGACILSLSCMIIPCYGVVFAWTLYYLYSSFSAVLPWTACDNTWNTPHCVVVGETRRNSSMSPPLKSVHANMNVTANRRDGINYKDINTTERVSNTFEHTSTEQFFQYKALGVSSGIDDLVSLQLHLVICWFITCFAVFLCIMKGIKSFGKVLYVTALMPYFLLLVLLVRSCTMPGAVDGILFYLTPDFSRLQHPQVWLEALIQVFFSVGTTWGVIIAMAGHNSFHANLIRDPIIVTVTGELTSLFAGFVVFATVGFLAHDLQLPVSHVIIPGPGIAFIIYPEAVALLPLPQLWSVLFFTTMLMMAIDSVAGNVETAIDCIEDILPRQYQSRPVIAAVYMVAVFLGGLVFTTHGGVYVFQLVDWYMGAVACFLMAILECVIVGWCYGARRFSSDVEAMIGKRLPVIFRIVCFIVLPALVTVALVSTLVAYKPPTYGDYNYPEAAVGVGWFIAIVTIVPIPIVMVILLLKADGSFIQRVKSAMKPGTPWPDSRHSLKETPDSTKDNFLFIIGLK